MKKLAWTMLALLLSKGLVAGEVGANPPTETVEVELASVALDPGTSKSWSYEPFAGKATVHQIKRMNDRIEVFNAMLDADIEALISNKIAQQLEI